MGVIRVEHQSNYTVMSNEHLRDPRLSLRAMGLMSRMLSDSDSYHHSIAGLAAVCKEGRDAVRKALQELEAAGYLVREQTRQGGSFAACDYILYEHSRIPIEAAAPLTENPTTVEPPLTEKPTTGKPTTENPTQRNTNLEEILTKEPPIVPQTGDGAPEKKPRRHRADYKAAPDWEPACFERFWALYPAKGKKDKQAAIDEWDKLQPARELMLTMSAALKRDIASEEWQRGIGIPYACRWLRRRRWEDDHEESAAPPPPRDAGREMKVKWL